MLCPKCNKVMKYVKLTGRGIKEEYECCEKCGFKKPLNEFKQEEWWK